MLHRSTPGWPGLAPFMGGEEEKTLKAGDLDTVVNDQIKSYQSIVGNWLKNSTAKKTSKAVVSQSTEPLNPTGRPARYTSYAFSWF